MEGGYKASWSCLNGKSLAHNTPTHTYLNSTKHLPIKRARTSKTADSEDDQEVGILLLGTIHALSLVVRPLLCEVGALAREIRPLNHSKQTAGQKQK